MIHCTRDVYKRQGVGRYRDDAEEVFAKMNEICRKYGLNAVTPMDQAPGVKKVETDNPYTWASNVFDNYQQHVRNCDVIIADLNDYRGYEVNNDVGFECGMGFQLEMCIRDRERRSGGLRAAGDAHELHLEDQSVVAGGICQLRGTVRGGL